MQPARPPQSIVWTPKFQAGVSLALFGGAMVGPVIMDLPPQGMSSRIFQGEQIGCAVALFHHVVTGIPREYRPLLGTDLLRRIVPQRLRETWAPVQDLAAVYALLMVIIAASALEASGPGFYAGALLAVGAVRCTVILFQAPDAQQTP